MNNDIRKVDVIFLMKEYDVSKDQNSNFSIENFCEKFMPNSKPAKKISEDDGGYSDDFDEETKDVPKN